MAEKLKLNATQANRALKTLTDRVTAYNEQIKATNKQLRDLSKSSTKINEEFGKQVTAVRAVSKSYQTAVTNLSKTITNLKDAAKASTPVVKSFDRIKAASQGASTALSSASRRAQTFAERFSEANKALGKEIRNIRGAASVMREFNQEMKSIVQTMKKKNGIIRDQTAATNTESKAVKSLTAQLFDLQIHTRSVSSILKSFVFFRVFNLLSQALREAVSEAKDLNRAVTEIRTISDRSALSTHQWTQELTTLAANFGVDRIESAEAAYQALSNQVTTTRDTMSFLDEQVRLSAITVASLDDAVQTSTSVINAYGFGANAAAEVTALLFKTVELGRTRLSEMANTLGRVSILSDQLGVSFIEQQAALTLLTRQGIKMQEAITLLRNVELKLLKPTEAMEELFVKWGVTSGEAAIATFGLAGVLNKFAQEAQAGGDAASEMAEIFGRMRAIVGATALTQKDFNAEILKFGDAGAKSVGAFNEVMGSLSKRADIEIEKVKALFIEGFGTPALRRLVEFSEAVGGADEALSVLFRTVGRALQLYVSYKVAALSASIATRTLAGNTLSMSAAFIALRTRATAAVAALRTVQGAQAGITLGATLFIDALVQDAFAFERFSNSVSTNAAKVERAFQRLGVQEFGKKQAFFQDSFLGFEQALTNASRSFNQVVANIRQRNTALTTDLQNRWEETSESIKDSLDKIVEGDGDKLKELEQSINDNVRAIKDQQKALAQLDKDAFNNDLDIKLEQAGVGESITAIANRLANLREELAGLKDTEKIDEINQKISTLGQFGETPKTIGELRSELVKLLDLQEAFRTQALGQIKNGDLEKSAELYDRIATIQKEVNDRLSEIAQQSRNNKDEATARDALEKAVELEQTRRKIVDERIAAERAFLEEQKAAFEQRKQVEEQAKQAEEQRLATQKENLETLKKIFAQIDQLKPTDINQLAKFENLAAQAGGLLGGAGLTPEAQLDLARDLGQQRVTLNRQFAAQVAQDNLQTAQDNINKITEAHKKAVEERKNLEAEVNKTATERVPAQLGETIGKLQALFEDKFAGNIFAFDPTEKNGPSTRTLDQEEQRIKQLKTAVEDLARAQGFEAQAASAGRLSAQITKTIEQLEALDKLTLIIPGLLNGTSLKGPNQSTNKLGEDSSVAEQITNLRNVLVTLKDFEKQGSDNALQQHDLEEALARIRSKLNDLPEAWKNQTDAALNGTRQQITTQQELNALLDETIRKLQNAASLNKQAGGKAFGGFNRLAHGGRGLDHRPTLLDDNEFVMNRLSSRQFAPLLSALNSAPPSFNQGSTVNFGDINVSVAGSSSDQTEQFINQIKRAGRMGLLSF